MRSFAIACAGLMLFAATAAGGELAVSKVALDSMGLSGMRSMSDNEGMAVRGKGHFSNVWGGSSATWGPQHSENFYAAGGGGSAGGNSLSFAAKIELYFAADSGPGPGMGGFILEVHAAAGIAGGAANALAN
jgi:hypothetical protein